MYIKIADIFQALAALLLLTGCHGNKTDNRAIEEIEATDSIPSTVKQLVKAVADNDSTNFARLVSYPLQRPYPLHDIEDEHQMRSYYKEMVDDSLRNAITKSGPDHWKEYGWRGWSLDDGSYIWIDENVYDVQYVSQKERKMIDSLTNEELRSISPKIREGWRPVLCMEEETGGKVYRVDMRTDKKGSSEKHYRVAVYNSKDRLGELPDRLVEGDMDSEGTAGTVIYTFTDPEEGEYVLEPEATDTDTPVIILPGDSTVNLKRAYWHELVRRKGVNK